MAHRFLDGLPFWIAWWFGPVRELWKSLPEGSQATLRQYHLAVEYHISLIIWVVLKMRKIPKPLGPWVSKFAGLMTGWGGTHDLGNRHLPSGKLLHNYGKSPWLMGKSTVSMDFFLQFAMLICQRVQVVYEKWWNFANVSRGRSFWFPP